MYVCAIEVMKSSHSFSGYRRLRIVVFASPAPTDEQQLMAELPMVPSRIISASGLVAVAAGMLAWWLTGASYNIPRTGAKRFLLLEFMDVMMNFVAYSLCDGEGDLDFENDTSRLVAAALLGSHLPEGGLLHVLWLRTPAKREIESVMVGQTV